MYVCMYIYIYIYILGCFSCPLPPRIMLLKIYLLHIALINISGKFQLNRSSIDGAKPKILEI